MKFKRLKPIPLVFASILAGLDALLLASPFLGGCQEQSIEYCNKLFGEGFPFLAILHPFALVASSITSLLGALIDLLVPFDLLMSDAYLLFVWALFALFGIIQYAYLGHLLGELITKLISKLGAKK